jgi:hypothetical protein
MPSTLFGRKGVNPNFLIPDAPDVLFQAPHPSWCMEQLVEGLQVGGWIRTEDFPASQVDQERHGLPSLVSHYQKMTADLWRPVVVLDQRGG